LECGQLQLLNPAPAALLRSPHSWISYIEPEGHLDSVADEICSLPGARNDWRVGAVTYKDASTLARLHRRGWTNTWQLDPASDLGITDGSVDLAIIQDQLTVERARAIAATRGVVDVLLVRHILEHTHRPREFLAALGQMVKPGGVMILECPDSSKAFINREYTVLWEEHLWYFTPELFSRFFANFEMRLLRLLIFPYPVENTLVAFVRPHEREDNIRAPSPSKLEDEHGQMLRYAKEFPFQKAAWQDWFRSQAGRVATFGAGHSTCAFINVFELGPYIEFVADDHPKKQGLYLPGCATPILPSAKLNDAGIDWCLMGLSPESESKVLARQQAAVERGVKFLSIFPMSSRAASVVKPQPGTSPDVLRSDPDLPMLSDASVAQLRDSVRRSSRYRNRYCGHAYATAALHEMLICLHANTYVRPHRHHGKAESVQVVDGFADLVLFTNDGAIDQIVSLGPPGSGLPWYVRLARPVFHTLLLRGEEFIFMETTLGPFRREDTEMAAWAPDDSDVVGIAKYATGLLADALTRAPEAHRSAPA